MCDIKNHLDNIKQRRKNTEYVRKCRSKLSNEKKSYLNQYYCRTWKAWIGRYTNLCIYEDRNKNRIFDIDTKFVSDMLEDQNGRCKITNIKMTHDKSMNSMSIDRINSNYGHTRSNIQLLCRAANLAKNKHHDIDLHKLLKNIMEPDFVPTNKISRDFISSSIRNHIRHDIKKGRKYNIDTDYIINLFNENNKCFFTNINIAPYGDPMFGLSIDRIDNSIGHIKGNVRLVIRSINRAKRDYCDNDVVNWINEVKSNYQIGLCDADICKRSIL